MALLCLFAQGAWADGPFTFTSWVYNSYTRVGGTEGTATYVCNAPIYMEQKGVTITNAGDLTISFQYTSGGKRLEIYGVELISEEQGSSFTNYKHEFAGSGAAKTYTLSDVAAGTYTLHIWSSEYGDGNSYLLSGGTNGNITYSGDAASGANLTITSWSKDNWKKSGAAIPTEVSSTIKAKGWKSYNNIHYHDDENLTFSEAKTYNINYNYTGRDGGGNERMDIRGVEVLDESGNVVACDYHEGYTGNAASDRDYKVKVPAGTYTVRTLVQTGNANDVRCKGNITYSVINSSELADNYTNSIKPNLYDNDVLKIGAPAQSLLTALDAAIESGNDIAIEAAYNAAMTTNNLNLPTGYYYFHSLADDRSEPYLYNNYFLENNTQHHTLQSASKVTTNAGIWYVENNGTTINIKNGDGQPLVQGNQNQGNTGGVTVRNTLTFGNYNASKFAEWGYKGIYFTEGLNAANTNDYSVNNSFDTRFVTTWANQPNKKDDNWTFESVENLNIYNVVVRGADAYVTLNNTNEYAFNGGFFNAESINKEDLTAQNVDGLNPKIEVSGNTITVTYVANHPYLVFKCERGGIVANTNGNLTTAAYDETADNQKFLLVNIENKDYLYNLALQKFVTSPASGTQLILVDYPHHAYTTTNANNPNGVYTKILRMNGSTMNNNNGGAMVINYETEDAGNKYQINEVGGISNAEYDALVASIKAACDAKKADMKTANDAYSTTALGAYHWENITATTEAVNASQALDTEAENYYTSLFAEIRKFDIAYQPTLNMPQGGTFLRLKGGVSEKYVNANSLADQTNRAARVGMSASDDAGSIWYLDADKHLISYSKGYYITNTCDHSGTAQNASVYIFEASNSTPGRYYIHTSGSVFYDNGQPNDRQCVDRQGLGRIAQTEKWILEEVTELPVSLAAIDGHCYGTLYTPVALDLSEGMGMTKAYAVEVEGDKANMVTVGDVIPANSAVVLYSNSSYNTNINIPIGGNATYEDSNALTGQVATTAVDPGTVLTMQNGTTGVGFYNFTGATVKGFKAYLPKERVQGIQSFTFNFDDIVTGIQQLEGANQPAQTFDLSGRQVSKAQRGLYIINGHKVMR